MFLSFYYIDLQIKSKKGEKTMGYHAINEGSEIPVYWQSICTEDARCGTLYNGEVFTFIKEHNGYFGNYQICYLNKNGVYEYGFINQGQYGNLIYSGTKINISKLPICYRFKLRVPLNIVDSKGNFQLDLDAGDYIYSQSGTAGESNCANMAIVGYCHNNQITPYTGFVTLDYTGGSMFASNFCLQYG